MKEINCQPFRNLYSPLEWERINKRNHPGRQTTSLKQHHHRKGATGIYSQLQKINLDIPFFSIQSVYAKLREENARIMKDDFRNNEWRSTREVLSQRIHPKCCSLQRKWNKPIHTANSESIASYRLLLYLPIHNKITQLKFEYIIFDFGGK